MSDNFPPKSELTVGDSWVMGQGIQDGAPIFIRSNTALREIAGHPEYPLQVGIAIPLKDTNEHRLPTDKEAELLWEIEDKIEEMLTSDNELILATILTFPGVREFSLYASDVEIVKARFEALQKSVKSHELQLNVQEDKSWEVFKTFDPK